MRGDGGGGFHARKTESPQTVKPKKADDKIYVCKISINILSKLFYMKIQRHRGKYL